MALTDGLKEKVLEDMRRKLEFRHYYFMKLRDESLKDGTISYYRLYILDERDRGKLLPKSLPFSEIGHGKELERFKLEYTNDYVYVYRVV